MHKETCAPLTYLPLFFADPELVEGSQARENASTQPTSVASFDRIAGCMDLCLFEGKMRTSVNDKLQEHAKKTRELKNKTRGFKMTRRNTYMRERPRHFRVQTIRQSCKQTATTCQDDVTHEDLAKLWVAGPE
jgi:hypothetical protein